MRDVSHNPQFEQCSFAGYDWPGLIGWPLRSLIVDGDDDDFIEVAFVRVLVLGVVLLENDDSENHDGEVTDDDDDRCMIISSYLFSDVCVVCGGWVLVCDT